MKHFLLTILLSFTALMITSCQQQQPTTKAVPQWETQLSEKMPLLGHRNWIVITDMAYPLQSGAGITTLFADEPYTEVLRKVKAQIDAAPHVFAHVYHDRELDFIAEADMPGVDSLRAEMAKICGPEAQAVLHEDLLKRMDEAGQLYNIVIIKTPLTMAYTTTFFELDCAYWNGAKQENLTKAMSEAAK